jgi:hypothetical protein
MRTKYSCEQKRLINLKLKGDFTMTNREGADIQEARNYVTSKQGNINAANNEMTNSSSNNFSSSSNVGGPVSSKRVSSARPMGATTDFSSSEMQKTINEARKAVTNPSSGNMQ